MPSTTKAVLIRVFYYYRTGYKKHTKHACMCSDFCMLAGYCMISWTNWSAHGPLICLTEGSGWMEWLLYLCQLGFSDDHIQLVICYQPTILIWYATSDSSVMLTLCIIQMFYCYFALIVQYCCKVQPSAWENTSAYCLLACLWDAGLMNEVMMLMIGVKAQMSGCRRQTKVVRIVMK